MCKANNRVAEIDWVVSNKECCDYVNSIEFMEKIAKDIIEKKSFNKIILTEYKAIITAGTSANSAEILIRQKIPIVQTGRGGKYTFHGEGQRIIYPIIDLTGSPWNQDLKKYLNFLHNWIIKTLKYFGISAHRRDDHIGVWVKKEGLDSKIAAIGIRVRKWVVFHGAAVNITTDLENFKSFIPCGVKNLGVTSMLEMGVKISLDEFDKILKKEYYNSILTL